MRFRLAKKILRGLYREHIPYTEDQIDSAYRRIGRVYGTWDRDFCYTTEPKGYTPRLHSPIQQRILEHLFEKEGGWDGLLVPTEPELHLAPVTITFQNGDDVWTTTGTFEVRHNQEAGTLDFTQPQPDHKELPDAIQ